VGKNFFALDQIDIAGLAAAPAEPFMLGARPPRPRRDSMSFEPVHPIRPGLDVKGHLEFATTWFRPKRSFDVVLFSASIDALVAAFFNKFPDVDLFCPSLYQHQAKRAKFEMIGNRVAYGRAHQDRRIEFLVQSFQP